MAALSLFHEQQCKQQRELSGSMLGCRSMSLCLQMVPRACCNSQTSPTWQTPMLTSASSTLQHGSNRQVAFPQQSKLLMAHATSVLALQLNQAVIPACCLCGGITSSISASGDGSQHQSSAQ